MASVRLYTGIAVMIVLLATIAVLGSLERPGVSVGTLTPRLHVDLIAVVDQDRRILTIEPDGSEPRVLTPASGGDPQLYTWPTWSPDARSLAITKVVGSSGPPVVSLERVDLETGDTSTIHSGFVQPMAAGVFYYPMWSPDGSRLAFIASEGEGLRLFVDIVDDGFAPNPVLDNGPLWMSWSPDSRRLLIHRADSHFLVEALEDRVDVLSLGIRSGGYRVPAWQPGSNKATFLAQNERAGFSLYSAEVSMEAGIGEIDRLADAEGDTPFLWSPDGSRLAVAGPSVIYVYLGLTIGIHRGMTIYREGSGEVLLETTDAVIAAFWSPDGSRIAYVSLSDTPGVLRWMMLDVRDGNRWPLVDFVPTLDQLTMFQFFDQYAYSHSLWSPDGRSLVFAGNLEDQASVVSYGSAQPADRPYIYVMDTERSPLVSSVAEGLLGVWSPR